MEARFSSDVAILKSSSTTLLHSCRLPKPPKPLTYTALTLLEDSKRERTTSTGALKPHVCAHT